MSHSIFMLDDNTTYYFYLLSCYDSLGSWEYILITLGIFKHNVNDKMLSNYRLELPEL